MYAYQGLSEAEAAQRLVAVGPNELPRPGKRGLTRIVAETMREPMFLLLIGAAVLYLGLGDVLEGLFLVGGATATISLVVFQEARSERALAALRDLAQPQARVVRGGIERLTPVRELVPGDLLLVGEGDRLPADAVLIAGDVLSVDESALTGESAPVIKRVLRADEPLGADPIPSAEPTPFLFCGTLVVRGQGVARVSRTGAHSALGQIGGSLADIAYEPTPLQKTAGRLVALFGLLAIGFCVVVVFAYGVLREDWVGGALAGVTVAISLIPEEFPMVLVVFLALGAWRLATHRVLVRRSAVIETLGAASVLCVDKTGTLTENRMRLARLWTETIDVQTDNDATVSGAALELLKFAGLASSVRPTDPMDRAIRELARKAEPNPRDDHVLPERHWPLRQDMMAVVHLWRQPDLSWVAAAKGAPEAIFKLCGLAPQVAGRLETVVRAFAELGLRVLGVASARGQTAFPDDPQDVAFAFEGLLGFLDPVRADVPRALKEASEAGIRVIMITGDHPATAAAIAKTAGIDLSSGVLLGSDLAALPFPTLRDQLKHVRVFARVAPEQKLLIVEALKADGEVVAMTGDGINDAPALEAANIGIAMGRKGTDVAREASDLILLDDSFVSIIEGVRLGRRIFSNLRRALTYIVAIHVPIAGLALAPVLLGLPPLLLPMHVVLLELAIDPICTLVFENEPSGAGAMKRPPRRSDEALFGSSQIGLALAQGAGVLAGVLGIYLWALGAASADEARGAAFVTLVLANLVLALTDAMSMDGRLFAAHRRIYWAIVAGIGFILLLVFVWPPLAAMFKVASPPTPLLAASIFIALVSGSWYGAAERVRMWRERRGTG